MYAVPAAQWPIIAATIGTTPLIATCSRNRSPAPANVEPLVAWMRAPAESSSHTIGMRWLSARWRSRRILFSPTAPIEPAITVKSYAATATLRPSISPTPVTEPSAARYRSPRPGIHVVGEHPVLDPGAGIEEQVEPLAHEELAERPLPLDELLAAHARAPAPGASRGRRRAAPSRARLRHRWKSWPHSCTARTCQSPGTPLSSWRPRSANSMPEPTTRSRTVEVTSTSSAPASPHTRGTDVHRHSGDVVTLQLHLAGVQTGAHLRPERPRAPVRSHRAHRTARAGPSKVARKSSPRVLDLAPAVIGELTAARA